MPNFHHGQYVLSVHGLATPREIEVFETIESPATIIYGIDLSNANEIWFVTNPDNLPDSYGVIGACGYYEDKPYNFFHGEEIYHIE